MFDKMNELEQNVNGKDDKVKKIMNTYYFYVTFPNAV